MHWTGFGSFKGSLVISHSVTSYVADGKGSGRSGLPFVVMWQRRHAQG